MHATLQHSHQLSMTLAGSPQAQPPLGRGTPAQVVAPQPDQLSEAGRDILQWLRDTRVAPASGGTWGAITESLVDEHQCTEGEDVLFMSADEWKQAGFKGVSVFKLQKMKDEKDR